MECFFRSIREETTFMSGKRFNLATVFLGVSWVQVNDLQSSRILDNLAICPNVHQFRLFVEFAKKKRGSRFDDEAVAISDKSVFKTKHILLKTDTVCSQTLKKLEPERLLSLKKGQNICRDGLAASTFDLHTSAFLSRRSWNQTFTPHLSR